MARPRDEQKIDAIYAASLALVLNKGFGGFKMSEVARNAGIATGTLYIYFKNKTELINQLYRHIKTRSVSALLHDYQPEESFELGFRKMWTNYMDYKIKWHDEGAYIEQYKRSPYQGEAAIEETNRMLQPLYDLLERGKREQLIIDAPTQVLVAQLAGSLNELARGHVDGKFLLDQRCRELALRMAWNSVKR